MTETVHKDMDSQKPNKAWGWYCPNCGKSSQETKEPIESMDIGLKVYECNECDDKFQFSVIFDDIDYRSEEYNSNQSGNNIVLKALEGRKMDLEQAITSYKYILDNNFTYNVVDTRNQIMRYERMLNETIEFIESIDKIIVLKK